MPLCKICGKELEPIREQTKVLGFPINTWRCAGCGFKRWPLNKEEYKEWDRLYAEKMKKPLPEKEDKKYVFQSLKPRDRKLRGTNYSDYSKKGHGSCDGDCSCDSGECDDSSGGGCSGGGCGNCGH